MSDKIMFGPNHYVPILRGKKGEIQALAHLDKYTRKKLTPFIDIPPTNPINIEGISLERHLFKINKPMRLAWGLDLPFFIDLPYISTQKVRHKQHPLDYILDEFRYTGLKAIPTTGLYRDVEYNSAVAKINSIDKRGVCIRLVKDDIEFAEELNGKLNDLQEFLGITPEQVHLLIDFKSLDEGETERFSEITINAINGLSNISKFKTLTISGSSFPEKVYKIEANTTKKIPRAEIKMREFILERSKEIARTPSFGDYGIVFPIPLIYDKLTNFGGKIRYTDDHDFVILRGQNFKKHPRGRQQYYDLSQKLVNMPEYKGQKYSWGDAQYERCASKFFFSGSLTTWVEIDTTHHLTFVANQISNSF